MCGKDALRVSPFSNPTCSFKSTTEAIAHCGSAYCVVSRFFLNPLWDVVTKIVTNEPN